tara:strand:+ start:43 stop:258 length:216 start_codon:yes stop_codon:yes gene_type:complete
MSKEKIEFDAELEDATRYILGPDRAVWVGRISNDKKGRFVDGEVVTTSLEVSYEGGLLRTLNTLYKISESS